MVAESLPYGWQERSPKQVAAIVLLILMAMVLSFVELPVVPGAEWLKYDPSGIVSLLATILYGSWIGVAVAVTSWIPHLSPIRSARHEHYGHRVAYPCGGDRVPSETVPDARRAGMRCRRWWCPRRFPFA